MIARDVELPVVVGTLQTPFTQTTLTERELAGLPVFDAVRTTVAPLKNSIWMAVGCKYSSLESYERPMTYVSLLGSITNDNSVDGAGRRYSLED